ncbi:MAG: saccharopine dehydrogenase NADP-binding domain-containing protein, partial [Candidatus Bathyarchaeia archaeon]
MHAVVLGGAGLTGRCAVRDLLETTSWDITVADYAFEKAKEFAEQLKSKRISVKHVDVKNIEETVKVIKDADIVINGVQYYFNIDVMKACLKAKVPYIDFGGLYHVTLKQLELDDEFKKAGQTALIGMGAQPGVSNLMIKYAADKLETVETVKIRDGWIDLTEGAPPFVVTWSFATIMDEITLPAVVFENGVFKEVPPLTGKETVHFPEPVGQQEVYLTLHSELATIPKSFLKKGLKNCDWKEGGPGFIRYTLLRDMCLTSEKPIEVKGVKIPPRDFVLKTLEANNLIGFPKNVEPNDYEITRVEVFGKRKGKNVTYVLDTIFPAKKEWHVSCSQYNVGV